MDYFDTCYGGVGEGVYTALLPHYFQTETLLILKFIFVPIILLTSAVSSNGQFREISVRIIDNQLYYQMLKILPPPMKKLKKFVKLFT